MVKNTALLPPFSVYFLLFWRDIAALLMLAHELLMNPSFTLDSKSITVPLDQ